MCELARTASAGVYVWEEIGFATRSSNLAFTAGGRGMFVLPGNQQFAENVNVASQNGEPQITFEAQLLAIAATLQAVARLQRANRGFNA